MYFLSSRDFVSQRIIKKIFNVSTFRIASRTYGAFSSRERKAAIAADSMASAKRLSTLLPREYRCVFGSVSWYVCHSLYAVFNFCNTGKIVRGGVSLEVCGAFSSFISTMISYLWKICFEHGKNSSKARKIKKTYRNFRYGSWIIFSRFTMT